MRTRLRYSDRSSHLRVPVTKGPCSAVSLFGFAVWLCLFGAFCSGAVGEDHPLWQIGEFDGETRELRLGPDSYRDYASDGFFVVGESDPARDWPYVHPGPNDDWAGRCAHTFTIAFALDAPPSADATMTVAFADTHSKSPPRLVVKVNGIASVYQTPVGAGDESIGGRPSAGSKHLLKIEIAASQLRTGVNRISLTNDAGSWLLYDAVALTAPGARLGKVPAGTVQRPPGPTSVEQVIVVFKTHFDIGYTDMAANVVQRYRTSMIDQALTVVDESRTLPPEHQFAWTIPGWPMAKILEEWPGQSSERRMRVLQAFKDGHFVVHGLPFTLHTELLETEDLVRGLDFAASVSRDAGLPLPRDAKMTDVPCHTWLIPTLLHHAGIDFLHLGCNPGSRSPEIPLLFWWEGPDGSRLLTMYSAETYGTGLMPPRDWPHKTWLALIHTGDNHGPPTPDEVKRLLAEAERRLPGVKVHIGKLSDFGDAIRAEGADLPVVRADMPDTWIHGPMCDPAGAAIARTVRPRIAIAEALAVELAGWRHQTPVAVPELRTAWEQSLLYGEHTWGGALSWVTPYDKVNFPYGDEWKADRAEGRFQRLEDSWAEHTAYIEKARDLVSPALEESLRALAADVHVDGTRVVVYNPLPWQRSGLVELTALPEGVSGLLMAAPSTVQDDQRESGIRSGPGESERPLSAPQAIKRAGSMEVASVERSDGIARVYLCDLPPQGYTTYVPVKAERRSSDLVADEASKSIESLFFKATLDPEHGAVRSLIDKRSGRDLVDPASPYGFGRYLYERFDADQVAAYVKAYVKIDAAWAVNEIGKPKMPPAAEMPYQAVGPSNCTLQLDRSPSIVCAKMEAGACESLPHAVTTKVILYQDQPYVDFEITLHDKPADPWPEAGWLCFPFAVDDPSFRIGRQNSIIDPTRDIVVGTNRHLCGVTSGVAIFNPQGCGIGLSAMDSMLMSLDSPGVLKYTPDFVPQHPAVFVNLFNNHWTTNFRMWNEGTWTSRVRIWSFESFDPAKSLIVPAWESRLPMMTALGDGPGGELKPSDTGVALTKAGTLVSAFMPNPYGQGVLLRLWEQAGQGGACQITLPAGLGAIAAQPCDLRGQSVGAPLPIRQNAFEVALEPFAPASYILTSSPVSAAAAATNSLVPGR